MCAALRWLRRLLQKRDAAEQKAQSPMDWSLELGALRSKLLLDLRVFGLCYDHRTLYSILTVH